MPDLRSELNHEPVVTIYRAEYADLWETVGQLLKDMRKIEESGVPIRQVRRFAGECIRKAEMVYPIIPIPR